MGRSHQPFPDSTPPPGEQLRGLCSRKEEDSYLAEAAFTPGTGLHPRGNSLRRTPRRLTVSRCGFSPAVQAEIRRSQKKTRWMSKI